MIFTPKILRNVLKGGHNYDDNGSFFDNFYNSVELSFITKKEFLKKNTKSH